MLTDTAIRNAKPGEKPYKVADSQSLYLLVNPRGSKFWHFKYRINGVERKSPSDVHQGRTAIVSRRARPAVPRAPPLHIPHRPRRWPLDPLHPTQAPQ